MVDGASRDIDGMQALDFPATEGRGADLSPGKGRFRWLPRAGATRRDGCLSGRRGLADANGVLVVPAGVAQEVLKRALTFAKPRSLLGKAGSSRE